MIFQTSTIRERGKNSHYDGIKIELVSYLFRGTISVIELNKTSYCYAKVLKSKLF
jgi:hypothetical protein